MTNDIWRSTLSSHLQTIDSHYYNITDSEAWPVAGLLVLLDGKGQPVRSELHLYEDLPSHIQEAAIRQSRLVLQERYHGGMPVPLRILHTLQMREAMDVRLPQAEAKPIVSRPLPWQSMALGGGLAVLVLLAWGLMVWMRSDNGGDSQAAGGTPLTEQAGALNSVIDTDEGDAVADDPSLQDAPAQDAPQAGVSGGISGGAVAVGPGQLPLSRNARDDIRIGMQVEILSGYQLALRSEAGATAGEVVGYMVGGDQGLVVGGPLMTQGDVDTIVWWLLEFDGGLQAWAAANTSEYTLLVPVE